MANKAQQLNRRQEEYLLEGLRGLRISRYDWVKREDTEAEAKIREQASVINAQLSKIDKAKEQESDRQEAAWTRKIEKFRKTILFGTPENSIKELERLQDEYRELPKRK